MDSVDSFQKQRRTAENLQRSVAGSLPNERGTFENHQRSVVGSFPNDSQADENHQQNVACGARTRARALKIAPRAQAKHVLSIAEQQGHGSTPAPKIGCAARRVFGAQSDVVFMSQVEASLVAAHLMSDLICNCWERAGQLVEKHGRTCCGYRDG